MASKNKKSNRLIKKINYKKVYQSPNYQDFSIPKPIIRYISKNPSSKSYSKIIQTCKYFYPLNPLNMVTSLDYRKSQWHIAFQNSYQSVGSISLPRIWLSGFLRIQPGTALMVSLASELIPKIERCGIVSLHLYSQHLTFDEFLFLSRSVKDFTFCYGTVKNSDGTIVQMETLIDNLPKLEELHYTFNGFTDSSEKTVQKLLQIQHFYNLKCITLERIPSLLNFDLFSTFMIDNKHIQYRLGFSRNAYFKEQIDKFKENLGNETFDDGVESPQIYFT